MFKTRSNYWPITVLRIAMLRVDMHVYERKKKHSPHMASSWNESQQTTRHDNVQLI